jgi:hypothetical protein
LISTHQRPATPIGDPVGFEIHVDQGGVGADGNRESSAELAQVYPTTP